LLAVVRDAEAAKPRPKDYPDSGAKDEVQSKGAKLFESIKASDEYKKWEKDEKAKRFEALGAVFKTFEAMTGLPTSKIYNQVLGIWRGDADYLTYLKIAASLAPGGGMLVKVVDQGLALTEKTRNAAKGLTGGLSDKALAELRKKGGGLVNSSDYGASRLDKQLALLKSPEEAKQVASELAETKLMKDALPAASNASKG
jgi:hypothetical protein